MANIINVEKASYLHENIETFTSNKVSQYSKFLNSNPLFVTYLSINEIETRNDVGTGGIASDIGPNSPIRFNQINGLPVFNIPELKPEILFDDKNGYNVEMDITDAAIPPNTLKPKTGDYMIIKIPNSIQVVFRINAFSYNTIQSNDFYLFNCDLKYAGTEDQLKRFKPQIVDVYETIFDNIGTQDKCFILSKDIEKLKNMGLLINELLDLYKVNYFDHLTGTFVSKNNDENVDPDGTDSWYYDKYVTKFIMDSQIYYDQNGANTIALAPEDIAEKSDMWYRKTLFYAVLKKDTVLLGRFPYAYQVGIQMSKSVFIIYEIKCRTSYLHITNYKLNEGHSDGLDSLYLYEYFPHKMIHEIVDNDLFNDPIDSKYDPHTCWKENLRGEEGDENDENQSRGSTSTRNDQEEYASKKDDNSKELSNDVKSKTKFYIGCGDVTRVEHSREEPTPPEPELPEEDSYQLTYLDEIVIHYLLDQKFDISREKIMPYVLQDNNYSYKMIPMIIYIIVQYYNSYFKEEKITDL